MKSEKTKIPFEMLDLVTGGTMDEINELKDFISQHDSSWTYHDAADVGSWLVVNLDLKGTDLMMGEENGYRNENGSLTHEGLMEMLRKKFEKS